jgi:Predicted membrane protein
MKKQADPSVLWKDRKRILFFGLPFSFTKYSLTEDRLFVNSGFFTSKEDEVRLYRVIDLELTRTLLQRLFKLGTIKCFSADKSLGDFYIKNIKNAKEVKELISVKVEEQRKSQRVTTRETMLDNPDDLDGHGYDVL